MGAPTRIDEIDIKILSLLIKDARTRLKIIAKECGITSVSTLNRIKRLKARGVITGAIIWPRLDALDISITATIGIDLDSNQDEVIKFIRDEMNFGEPSEAVGKYDLLVFAVAKNITELDKAAYEIRRCSGVRKVTVNVWAGKPHQLFENVDLRPVGAE